MLIYSGSNICILYRFDKSLLNWSFEPKSSRRAERIIQLLATSAYDVRAGIILIKM